VVRIVSLEVPEPGTEPGVNEHVAGGFTAGTILLQDKLNVPSKPFMGVMVMVDVADPPAATVAGESAEPVIVKSGDAM
jgi:hypothetical protein